MSHTITQLSKLLSTTVTLLIIGFIVVLLEGCGSISHRPETFPYVCYASWSVCA